MYVFKSAMVSRKELDTCKWDPEKTDTMYKSSTARFDAVETIRYIGMEHPEPSKICGIEDAEFIEMEKKDRATASEWRELHRRRALNASKKSNALQGMDSDDGCTPQQDFLSRGKYDWDNE
jgi:hypothetical protein